MIFTLQFPSGVLASGSCGYSFHESRWLRRMAADAWFGLDPAFSHNGLVPQIGKKAGDATAREDLMRSPKNQLAVEINAFAEAIAAGRESHVRRGRISGRGDCRSNLRGRGRRQRCQAVGINRRARCDARAALTSTPFRVCQGRHLRQG